MNLPYKQADVLLGFGSARARHQAYGAIRKLWALRQSQGMTQSDLIDLTGKNKSWISRNLSGPSNWTLRTFGEFADALGGEIVIQVKDLYAQPSKANGDIYSGYGQVLDKATSTADSPGSEVHLTVDSAAISDRVKPSSNNTAIFTQGPR